MPLLLQMKQDKVALSKAVDYGDTDLGEFASESLSYRTHCLIVYSVLLHLRTSLSPGDFFHLLDDSISPELAPAVKLLQVYAKEADRQLLRDFYYQTIGERRTPVWRCKRRLRLRYARHSKPTYL